MAWAKESDPDMKDIYHDDMEESQETIAKLKAQIEFLDKRMNEAAEKQEW